MNLEALFPFLWEVFGASLVATAGFSGSLLIALFFIVRIYESISGVTER